MNDISIMLLLKNNNDTHYLAAMLMPGTVVSSKF